jgi:transcription elongation factor GreA
MSDRIPITREGYQQLREELAQKEAERPKIAAMIAKARSYGDLKENSEYHSAKEKQGLLEATIRDLEAKLAQAMIIDGRQGVRSDRVNYGSLVTIEDISSKARFQYKLVGPAEADPEADLISTASPVGKALLGGKPGQMVQVQTPGGLRTYTIVAVQ